MNQSTGALRKPPPEMIAALTMMREGNHASALAIAESALPLAADRAPFLAIAGMSALQTGAPERAVAPLRELVELRPSDMPSRLNLANALIAIGDLAGALAVAQGSQDPLLARVEGFVHQGEGRTEEAMVAYRKAVDFDPNDFPSWNNLANLYSQSGNLEGSVEAYERAIALSPGELEPRINLAEVLRRADRPKARLKAMRGAERLAPHDRRVLTELAMAEAHDDDLEGAIARLESVVARYPEFGESHIELGRLYEAVNRIDAMAKLIATIDLSSAPPEAAFLLAWQAQRENRFEDAAALAEAIPETVHPMRRFHLIGQIADRLGDGETAFAAFERMNAATLTEIPAPAGRTYRESIEADLERWDTSWAAEFKPHAGTGGRTDPIFLVGFPRSGTTLLDTMLMGLPDLSVLEEKPMMAEVAKTVGEEDLSTLPEQKTDELRARYFASARDNGWNDDRWLVDKHPLNMARVPLIHRLFPNARFILAERHPYDVVLSCFMANFQPNFAMRSFTTLEEAARTYDAVFSAWERAGELFDLQIRRVRYERLVIDARGELEPLVQWLGLAWDDRMLAHSDTAKSRGRVKTASYSQIRETLYTRASGRWRRYADQLDPVMPILAPWAARMGYETA